MNEGLTLADATFFANVQALENAAASHYAEAANSALAAGNTELEGFFASLAELTRIEAQEAHLRAGRGSLVLSKLRAFVDQPRSAIKVGGPAMLALHQATCRALELKRRSHAYFASVVRNTGDTQLRQTAQAFQHEAAAHLVALENWIVRLTA